MKLMNRWLGTLIFVVLIGAGSFVNFYVTNLLITDLMNLFKGSIDNQIVATIPSLMINFDFVLIIIFFARLLRHPGCRKSLVHFYSIILICFSLIGIVTGILGGTIVYHGFFQPYPFKLYTVSCLIVNSILCAVGVTFYFISRLILKDTEHHVIDRRYVFYNFFSVAFIYFVLNRTGALLWSFSYISPSTINLAWPFYVWLALPLFALFLYSISIFNYFKNRHRVAIVTSSVILTLNLGFTVTFMTLAYFSNDFISAVSPAMPISRLTCIPIDAILMFLMITILPLLNSYYLFKKRPKVAEIVEKLAK